jgi:preprotein translocase subunit SecE
VARDRKRAKQRRARRGPGRAQPAPERSQPTPERSQPAPERSQPTPGRSEPTPAPHSSIGQVERADLPGALEHAGDVDEFDAALIAGAGGVAATPETLSEAEIEAEAEAEGDLTEDELQEPPGPSGPGGAGGGGGGDGVSPERASGAPLRKGNRAIGFLRASWAELQRVQWPDRRHVFQATAVVLGFVAIAGVYLGLADYVAKEIVEFIL